MAEKSLAEKLREADEDNRAGRLAEAERKCREILLQSPSNLSALNLASIIARRQGKLTEAVEIAARATVAHPGVAELHANLGEFSRGAKRMQESIAAFERAVELKPNEPTFHNSLGTVYGEIRRYDKAEEAIRKAIQAQPAYAEAWNNLGGVLRQMNRLPEAERAIGFALRLQPTLAMAHANLAIVLTDMERYGEAIASYRKAITAREDYREAHHNLGMLYLLLGDFAKGWVEYQWRPGAGFRLKQPLWHGEDLQGKTILLYGEQGLGDTIQFVRYVALLKERGARVVLLCQKELWKLFRQVVEIAEPGGKLPAFDFYYPLLSLGLMLNTRIESIPWRGAYLWAQEDISRIWSKRLGSRKGMRVGLCWAGRATHAEDARRSISLDRFEPILKTLGVEFFSLQVGTAAAQAVEKRIADWTTELKDFSDTAGLVEQLDLVITVDTSVAHLAAAMGKRVWLLLSRICDWRWMLERTDSPWYPTMRLFRQKKPNDWDPVISEIARNLKDG